MPGKIVYIEDAFAALQNGEEKGLDYFFDRYYSPLLFFSISIINDDHAAKDIVAETFIKLWRLRTEMNNCEHVKFTLYRIVRNASIDYTKSRKRFKQAIAGAHSYVSSYEGDALSKLTEIETYNRLHLLISSLPLKCRQVFQMFYFHDKSIKAIAEELKISTNTVKSQKKRALELLREKQSLLVSLVIFCSLFLVA